MTRCKVDDLAVVVVSDGANLGKTCRVLRMSDWKFMVSPNGSRVYGVVWETDQVFITHTGTTSHIFDAQLRPIRPQADDAQDESKAWLPPVPTHEKDLA